MSDNQANLAELRRELDVLDDQIQELLRRRAEAVQRVAQVKAGQNGNGAFFFRGGREAQIHRRLLARHQGPLPQPSLLRIFREMISGLYELQAPISVAVLAPNKSVARWDLARDHFGSTTPMQLCSTPSAAMRAVGAAPATIGVMPLPEEGEREPWWPWLANRGADVPRVVAKLPFVANTRGRIAELGAFVIARCPPEASGEDRSLAILTLEEQAPSHARLARLLEQAGFQGRVLAQHRQEGQGARVLVELDGFIQDDDPRYAALRDQEPGLVADLVPIGAYAVPA